MKNEGKVTTMQYDKHGNGKGFDDLYILPETEEEKNRVVEYLKRNNLNFSWRVSNVKGNDWYRKRFIDVPFCESWRKDIEKVMKDRI